MAKPIDLKSTLNLPRTEFPMKAKLPEREPVQLAGWEQMRLYHRILDSRAGAPLFVLHDGPPYPTGEIHLGTGLNKIVKDMIVKSKTMAGFRSPYIPGWDCHGLPIETKVEKELGGKTTKVSAAEFRRRCREYASRYVEAHKRDFKRLGVFGQWDKPYLTMDPSMEACTAGAFIDFLEKGYVYRGLKPVYWCIYDRTALAEAEVEYEDHTSPSIWVKFPVVEGANAVKLGADVSALIWTTTPWTLPANRALAFHPEFEYVVADTSAGKLLLAKERVDASPQELGLEIRSVTGGWKGREFEGAKFRHPFLDLRVPGVLADYVTLDQGSGIVHTAPGHGAEDFYTGQKYGLETYAPHDDDGRFIEGLPEYKGKTVFEANPIIVELLKQRGMLVGERKLTHSYPHCWRCHNPVIFRATEQWFIELDHDDLRKKALAEIAKVKWKPEWGEARIHDMVAERPDWCISRQRFWGVPLIVFYCEACGKQLKDFQALRHVLPFFEREGADAWYTHSAEELLPPGTKCACGASKWKKENDMLDVWFDSGSTNLAVLSEKDGTWPADVYLEGPDQYRGWFHSSLLVAMGIKGRAPYREVVTHGWTLDEKGQPMSKSLGNVMEPNEIVAKWGADLLRVWVASQDYTTDVRLVRGDDAAARRGVSQDSQHVPLRALESLRFRSGARFRSRFRAMGNGRVDAAPHRRCDSRMPRVVRQFRFPSRLSPAARFLQRRFERVLFRRAEGPPLHVRAEQSRAAAPRRRRCIASRARCCVSSRPFSSSRRRKSGSFSRTLPAIPKASTWRCFPPPRNSSKRWIRDRANNWDRLLAVREEVLKALEPLRAAKTISANLEARVTLVAIGRSGGAIAEISRVPARAVYRVSG